MIHFNITYFFELLLNLFFWGKFFVYLDNFSLILETSLLPIKGCTFLPMLDTYDQWAMRFFSVPHLLWHGPSVYNGHLRGPVTLTLNAEPFVSGTVTTCFYDLGLSWLGFQHPTIRLRGELSNPLHHRRAACMYFWNNS